MMTIKLPWKPLAALWLLAAIGAGHQYAFAQDAAKAPPPKAPPASPPGFVICDVIYTVDVTTTVDGTERNVWTASSTVWALPAADVIENSKWGLEIVDAMSKEQDKGGPYIAEAGEIRNCDGKGPQKYAPTSLQIIGLTLDGGTRIGDVAIDVAGRVNKRFKDRVKKGDKTAWGHAKACKAERNDLAQRVKDPICK